MISDNNTLDISYLDTYQADLLSMITDYDSDLTDLEDFFREFSIKEDVYIILPDNVFANIDIFEWESDDDMSKRISAVSNKNLNDLYYSCPIICSPKGQQRKTTACIIEKYIVDNICTAARNAKIRLVSVEPASIAFLRTKENFHSESIILEIFEKSAAIIAYSGIAGAFKMNKPDLRLEAYRYQDPSDLDEAVYFEAINTDQIAAEMYDGIFNINVPYYIISSKKIKLDSMSGRLFKQKDWPGCVSSAPATEQVAPWLPLLGTVLTNLPDEQVFKKIPSYMSFESANVLPAEAIKSAKALQLKDKAVSMIKTAMAFMFLLLVAENAAAFYFSSLTIPQQLQEDYDAAYSSSGDISSEIDLIKTAHNEDTEAIAGFSELVNTKPQDLGFISVEFSSSQSASQGGWLTVSAASADPLKFQDYLAGLSMNQAFSKPTITRMSSESSGMKIAEITARKGDLK